METATKRMENLIHQRQQRQQRQLKKITNVDMKSFSNNFPLLSNVLSDCMANNGLLYTEENHLKAAEERLKKCINCKAGENCLDSFSCDFNGKPRPVENAGQKPTGLNDEGFITYQECEKWLHFTRAEHLQGIGIPPLFQNCSFDNFESPNEKAKKALKACKDFTDSIINGDNPKGIFLSGPFGCGKSHLGAATLIALANAKVEGLQFVFVPELLAQIMRTYNTDDNRDYIKEAAMNNVICLDDIGAERISAWSRDQLSLLVNERYAHQRPTIMTTNASMEELENRLGGAIISRIWEMTKGFVMSGPDYRKSKKGNS